MKKIIGLSAILLLTSMAMAREDVNVKKVNSNGNSGYSYRNAMKFGSDCDPATQQADLDINNVRTKILNGGDMWWDLTNPKYEVPKLDDLNSVKKHSLFSGAIWIGGEDLGKNLKLAAMTYRQRGSDFWPGPLDEVTGNTNANICQEYDKIFKVDAENIIAHVDEYKKNGVVAVLNNQIEAWPGQGNFGFTTRPLAPFFDQNSDGIYDPRNGDYPILQDECNGESLENLPEDQPDQMLWFIYNDKGNIHSETQGEPIGVELQTTAFAFETNDEVNDMTFYTTRIINRGFNELRNTYFGQWVDPDLGNYQDDFVGCDVGLSLGFCYNGDDNDEGVLGYGLNPPSIGVDFFEGPKVDTVILGQPQQVELGMSKFVYYNNDGDPINGNPNTAPQFYNYLKGRWMNSAQIEFGGDGITGTDGTPASYMFPFDTDTTHPGKNWNEKQAGNTPADRRFLQSSGPFVLKRGAVQKLTVGIVWARSSFGGADGSLGLLKVASQTAQELFNSCFDLVDGPAAPPIEVQELDRELIMTFALENKEAIKKIEGYKDSVVNGFDELEKYDFQGYRLFQLKDNTVSLSGLDDVNEAREVFQCDVKDEYGNIINFEFDPDVQLFVPKLEVAGANQGIVHTVSLTEDAFATGSNKELVNFKTYYYIAVAYAAGESRNRTYLEGRKVQKFSAMPRKTEPRLDGSNIRTGYGGGPKITRLSGTGNGGNLIELTPESEAEILKQSNNYFQLNPTYQNGAGPVSIKVIDPLKVPKGNFELTFNEVRKVTSKSTDVLDGDSTYWVLVKLDDEAAGGDLTVESDTNIAYKNEQVILASTSETNLKDWGLSVTIEQVFGPGADEEDPDNGLLGYNVIWGDPSKEWLTAIEDIDVSTASAYAVYDWIRAGNQGAREAAQFGDPTWQDYAIGGEALDPGEAYERIWPGPNGGGRVAPYRLVANYPAIASAGRPSSLVQAIGYPLTANNTIGIDEIASIDLVITPDKTKWSECVMLEMGEDPALNEGGAEKFDLRTSSLSWSGGTLPPGKTIFPGYAINVETGERLNIIVTEDSYQISENGRDMKWNPTDNSGFYNQTYPSYGGRQYIYIMGSKQGISATLHPKLPIYDKGNAYYQILQNDVKQTALTKIFQNCMWVVPTYLAAGYEMKEGADQIPLPPTEYRLQVRTSQAYSFFDRTASVNDGHPKYTFNTNDIYNEVSQNNAKDAIELINIVPNPYYAYSGYETSVTDNRVMFTNLPRRCDISIYTLDGALVRRISKDDEETTLTWDIKNQARVPIASGLYIIHVDAFDLGEKVIKWMGVMRELDLDSF